MNKAMWEDCSNGWMCSKCFRDSTFDYHICPHCGCTMLNGSSVNPYQNRKEKKTMDMDDKKFTPKFTPTVAIKTPITSPFINKTESADNTVKFVKFDCTGVTHKSNG